VEQSTQNNGAPSQFIFLSRNSRLARMFQDPAPLRTVPRKASPPVSVHPQPGAAPTACPKLESVNNPTLELTRPLAMGLMREQAGLRCRMRGALLDNEYVRDVCTSGAHQQCPFLKS
jgi:hypothetical protein